MLDLNKKEEKQKSAFAQIFLDKEARLSKKSWHYQLLKFIIGESMIPKMNFCPYFWLTIFCMIVFLFYIILSPVILPIKGFIFIIKKGISILGDMYLEKVIIPSKKRYAKALENCSDVIFFGWLSYNNEIYLNAEYDNKRYLLTNSEWSLSTESSDSYKDKFIAWRNITPDWKEKIELWKKEREDNLEKRTQYYKDLAENIEKVEQKKKEDRREKERLALIRQNKLKNRFILIGKYMSVLLLIPLCYLLYYVSIGVIFLAKLCYTLYNKIHIDIDWLVVAEYTVHIIAWFSISFILIVVFRIIINRIKESLKNVCACSDSEPQKDSIILNVLYQIAKIIVWPLDKLFKLFKYIFYGIVDGISFFVIFIKNWKSDNCPEIIWEEDKEEEK